MKIFKNKNFFVFENAASVILFFATILALLCANSFFNSYYQTFFSLQIFSHSIFSWINDGLMALFFLFVGLELKQEFLIGELKHPSSILLPSLAALGGMIVPAFIYYLFNKHHINFLNGWAIPVATDIAFAVSVLNIFKKNIPKSLIYFLLALAIFDDLGAIIIIAFFHAQTIFWNYFFYIGLIILCLMSLNYFKNKILIFYLLLGLCLWYLFLKSGIHATISGVIFGFLIPLDVHQKKSLFLNLKNDLKKWVDYFILPIFAFANAGLNVSSIHLKTFSHPVFLGIFCGLFFGKQIGVFIFTRLTVYFGFAKLPRETTWRQIYCVSILCGIGFTMSLFLGTLSFRDEPNQYLMMTRFGVMFASFCSALFGAGLLFFVLKNRDLTK